MPSIARASTTSSKGSLSEWRFTKIMNMSDLSRDDDFLSHLFVEKLGTGSVPLLVHKMDPSRRLPKTDANDLLQIVRRLVIAKGQPAAAVREAVDDLLRLSPIRYYLQSFTQKQINAFATHASRYLELYHPSGSIEIAHTSRYADFTGKSELCILASRPLSVGAVITELKGSMADLTDEEDRELKRATTTGVSGIRRDFSVIHSKQLKKNHLFLGPARFVNHDCEHNVELFREGRYITFRVLKPIAIGEELTAHYGYDYFGRRNRHCLCSSCERAKRGGYTPEDRLASESSSDSDSDASENYSSSNATAEPVNVDERRTRRGVYAVMPKERDPVAEIELDVEEDSPSLSRSASAFGTLPGLATPESISRAPSTSSTLTSISSADTEQGFKGPRRVVAIRPSSRLQIVSTPEPFSSTRDASQQLVTPQKDTPTSSVRISARLQARHPDQPSSSRLATPTNERKSNKAKKAEVEEPRVLRPRPSLPAESASAVSSGKKGEGSSKNTKGSKKSNEQRFPSCSTCNGVLPVIAVDSEIVWGLEEVKIKGKGKKKMVEEKRECPRCMRHFAIYNVPWPTRVPTSGGPAFDPMPRRDSARPVGLANSSRNSSKTASTSLSSRPSLKSKLRRDEEEDTRSAKRQKLDEIARGRTQISTKSRLLLGVGKTRGDRDTLSGRKARDNVGGSIRTYGSKRKRSMKEDSSSSSSEDEESDAPPFPPPVKPKSLPKVERKIVPKIVKRSREERASARTHARAVIEKSTKGRKFSQDGESSGDEASHKRHRGLDSADKSGFIGGGENRPSNSLSPRRLAMMGAQKWSHTGTSYLLHAPNPLSFARRKWVPIPPPEPHPDDIFDLFPPFPISSEDESVPHSPFVDLKDMSASNSLHVAPKSPGGQSEGTSFAHSDREIINLLAEVSASDEESIDPVTPEDEIPISPSIAVVECDLEEVVLPPRTAPFVGRAMVKPSPASFAMRRWSTRVDATVTPPNHSTRAVDNFYGSKHLALVADLEKDISALSDSADSQTANKNSVPKAWFEKERNRQPTSPDTSRFILRKTASFEPIPTTDLVEDDTASLLITPSAKDVQVTFEVALPASKETTAHASNGANLKTKKRGSFSLSIIPLPTWLGGEACSSETNNTPGCDSLSPSSSRLVKAGWTCQQDDYISDNDS